MLTLDSKESRTNPTLRRYLVSRLNDDLLVDDLASGDIATLDTPLTLGIEHKSFNDFVGSLSSGRLDEQLARMVDLYDVPVLMIGSFLLGFLPMLAVHRTRLWSLRRRLATLEGTAATAAPPAPEPAAEPVVLRR